MDPQNLLIAIIIIGARLLVPLLIPRFPLPAIVACMLIDGIDQTIFQKYTTINLDGYQSYDKALDIYYLTIAYLSTMRNWTNQAAFRISQFLFYYRMVGNSLFELTGNRTLLFIFPNTFEYFFIFVSAVVLFYDMKKLSTKFLIGAAAFIWIFIKLPQEYWIHIAQLDTTDFIKEKILGVSATSSWSYAISQNMWVIPAIGIISLVLGVVIFKLIKRLPSPDHKIEYEYILKPLKDTKILETPKSYISLLKKYRFEFTEKIIMVGLISLIFAQMFPTLRASNVQVVMGTSVVILVNALMGYVLLKSSVFSVSTLNKFIPMFVINSFVSIIYVRILTGSDASVNTILVLFFAYIITLLTVLYDRFRPVYLSRL